MSTNQDSKEELRQLNVRVSLPIYQALVLEAAKRTVEAKHEVTKQDVLLDAYGLVSAARPAMERMGKNFRGLDDFTEAFKEIGAPVKAVIDGKMVRLQYVPQVQAYVPDGPAKPIMAYLNGKRVLIKWDDFAEAYVVVEEVEVAHAN